MEMRSLSRSVIIGSLLGLAWMLPATAQQAMLTRGEVYKLINNVQLLLNNRSPRSARVSDVMVPQDALRTASRSKAELLFNEGSLARIGSNAIFRFIPGLRGFQLRNGTALIMSPPTTASTRIETLEGQAVAEIPASSPPGSPASNVLSLAMVVQVDGVTQKTDFYNLTGTPIKITDAKGSFIFIQGGQTVSVLKGTLGEAKTFDLRTFYKTSGLAVGLGPGQDPIVLQEAPPVQQTLKAVRTATLATLDLQTKAIEGLCTLNARGGASTLTTNCITTNSDDPLRGALDRRDVVTPVPDRPIPQIPIPQAPPIVPQTPPVVTVPTTPPNPNAITGTPVLVQGGNNQALPVNNQPPGLR
ncbi:MAG: hypothetical protein LH702_21050 [Phormidesmis sp. CAN_BIN44]|nr:hypothetical protein [Phormidesmis sp. CAN_BIN44]